MIIVNKKRLVAIFSMVFVSLLAFTFNVAKKEETVSTVALPVSNKVIVLDARTWNSRWRSTK